MKSWVKAYVYFLFSWRWLVLAGVLAATAGVVVNGVSNFQFKGDYRVFFDEDNPQLAAHNALERTFSKADTVIFLVQPREGDVFQPRVLAAVNWLTERSWYLERALRVDSITNYTHTRAQGDELIVEELGESPAEMDAAERDYLRMVALGEPFLVNKVVARDGRTTAVATVFQLPDAAGTLGINITQQAREMLATVREAYPDIRFEVTGTILLSTSFTEVAIRDVQTIYPLMIAFLFGTMWWFLRSVWGATIAMVIVFLSAVGAFCLAMGVGVVLSPPTTSAFVIILTIAIADSIHIMVSMFNQMREGVPKREALAESMRINMQPVFLTSFTTAIGFLSLNFSDTPPIAAMGNIAALGAVAAYIYSIVLLPVLVDMLPVRAPAHARRDIHFLLGLVGFVERNRWPLTIGTVVIVGALAAFTPRLEVNDKFVEFFSEDMDFRVASDFAMENLSGIYIVEFSVDSGVSSGITDPGYLRKLDQFVRWIEAYPPYAHTGQGIQHVNTFNHVMRRLNKSMNGDDPAFYRLPDKRDLAAQYLLMYEMSLPIGRDLNDQINVDKSSTRVSVTMGDVSTGYIRQFYRDAVNWLNTELPAGWNSDVAGVTLMFSFMTERNVFSMMRGTALAFLAISLTLMIALRSFRLGMISLAPNVLPAIAVFGFWAAVVGEMGLYAAPVAVVSLGLIVDFTVHYLSKYLRARRERGASREEGLRYAMSTVGSALWVSAFVLIVGFCALILSDYRTNSLMGLMVAMIIAVALVSDFLFLPALLLLLDRKKRGKADEMASTPA